MPTKRKFYRTVIQVEILSEEPYVFSDLVDTNDDITIGHQSGKITTVVDSEEIDGKTCVSKLKEQGSDPAFFLLDEHANDVDDESFNEDDDDEYTIRKMKD